MSAYNNTTLVENTGQPYLKKKAMNKYFFRRTRITNEQLIIMPIKHRNWIWIGQTIRKPPDSATRMAPDSNP